MDNNELPLVDNPYSFRPLARMYAARLREAHCRFEIEQKFQMPCTWFDLLVLRRRAPKCAVPSVKRERRIEIHARSSEHKHVFALPDEIADAETVEMQKAQPVALSVPFAQRKAFVADLDRKAHDDREAAGGRST